MRGKAFIVVIMVVTGSWLAIQLTRNHFQYGIMRNRHQQISVTLKEIENIKNTLTSAARGPVSAQDLLSVIEINRLEGQIRDLRMENAIDLSKSNENAFPDIFPLILLIGIFLQTAMLNRKSNPESKPAA
jgi:ribosomal protein S28E/S33